MASIVTHRWRRWTGLTRQSLPPPAGPYALSRSGHSLGSRRRETELMQ